MKRRSVYLWVAACLLILAACSEETVLTGDKTPGDALVLKPGEREVSLLLNGVSASGAVPATRAEDAISLSGESTIDELVIYSFVNLDNSGASLTESDRWSYTLERKYHYKANAAGNDLILTADGSNYRITIPVLEDDKLRYFKMQVNMGDGSGVTAVAVDAADRTSATRTEGLPLPPLISANADVITTPLPMNGDCYWEEELTGGYTGKTYIFGKDDLKRGMQASLVRKVSRFDINNPANTRFTVTGITMKNVLPLSGSVSGTEPTYTLKASPENATFIPAAFYLPARNGNVSGMAITVTGTLAGVETTVEIPCTDLRLTDNTRYVINIIARGENLNGTIEIAPLKDADGEIDGEVTGELNEEVHVTGNEQLVLNITDNTIYVTRTIKYFELTLTGKTGNPAPIEVLFPDDGNVWRMTNAVDDENTWRGVVTCEYGTKLVPEYGNLMFEGYFDVDHECYYFPRFEGSVTFVTRATVNGIKERKYHEYKIIQVDDVTDTQAMLGFEGTMTLKTTGDWIINDADKIVTAPIFPNQGFIELTGGSVGIQFEHSGKEVAQVGRTCSPRGDYKFYYILRKDNFMSSEPRTFEMMVYNLNGTTNEQQVSRYKVIQPGGNGDTSLLSTGFTVDYSSSMYGCCWGTYDSSFNFIPNPSVVTYADGTLTIKAGAAVCNNEPATVAMYNISIRSKDQKPILVEIVQGAEWLYLDPFACRVADIEHYSIGFRTHNEVDGGAAYKGIIKVGYRDAASGRLKYEYIEVVKEAGGSTW